MRNKNLLRDSLRSFQENVVLGPYAALYVIYPSRVSTPTGVRVLRLSNGIFSARRYDDYGKRTTDRR
jgi:hypothetical protein